jgi:hypothetical protein
MCLQSLQVRECVADLAITNMLVVTFTGFVVIAENADSVGYERESVFVGVAASSQRSWNAPDRDLNEGRFRKDQPIAKKQLGHVGLYTNNCGCCQ